MGNPTWQDVENETTTDEAVTISKTITIDEDLTMEVIEYDDTPTTDLTVEEAQQVTSWIKLNKEVITVLLYKAKEGKAYKALGYANFDEYCQNEFGFTGATGARKAIQGEVALALEPYTDGAEKKLTQKEAKEIRDMLPIITEKIEEQEDDTIVDIEAIIEQARTEAAQHADDEELTPEELAILEKGTYNTEHEPTPQKPKEKKTLKSVKQTDKTPAPEYDGSTLTYEDIAAIQGKEVSEPNKVRDFTAWATKLPNPIEMGKLFRTFPKDVDTEFISTLPKKLEEIQHWIQDFLNEFNDKQ